MSCGTCPTVLQQLCALPMRFFTDARLRSFLMPTLIACTYDNAAARAVLELECSSALLSSFLEAL